MNDKIKACCENCANSDSCCNKRGFCNWYDGIGQTPEQRIAELEAENKKLKTENQTIKIRSLKTNDKTKETFYARFCGTPEEYALSALEFVCSEADRLEVENKELKETLQQLQDGIATAYRKGRRDALDIRSHVFPIRWEDYVGKNSFRGYIGLARVCYFKVNIDDYQTDIYFCIKDQEKISSIQLLCAPKMLYRAACQWCQDWLVSLVANACGLESDGDIYTWEE